MWLFIMKYLYLSIDMILNNHKLHEWLVRFLIFSFKIFLFFLAVNQAYVSKFLRGDLFDLSENGRMAICRWYIRYKKIVQSMGKLYLFLSLNINLIYNGNINDH